MLRPVLLASILLLVSSHLFAQDEAADAPADAAVTADDSGQFDFLIGQWELELTPRINGLVAMIHGTPRLVGSWKAWPAFDGRGIEDELRVTDGSGNPVLLSHAMRVVDPEHRRWAISVLDVYHASFSSAVAIRQGEDMFVGGSGINAEGRAFRSRSRFHAITADSFEMQQDRSYDGGASWEEATITIVAKRVAATAAH
jgi:hypothetical protein